MDFVFTALIENWRVYIFYQREKVIMQKFKPKVHSKVASHSVDPRGDLRIRVRRTYPFVRTHDGKGQAWTVGTSGPTPLSTLYFCHFEKEWKREKESGRPMSGRHPTSASEGWHERSRLTVRGVQITAPLSPPSVFPSSFCPKELGSPPSSSRGNTFRLYGWRRPYMLSMSRVFMSLYMRGNLVKGGTPF